MAEFNLGDCADDFWVPDGGLLQPDAAGTWLPTAPLIVEIPPAMRPRRSFPSTPPTRVDELLVIDPDEQKIHWLALADGDYRPIEQSRLIELGLAQLAKLIRWPVA